MEFGFTDVASTFYNCLIHCSLATDINKLQSESHPLYIVVIIVAFIEYKKIIFATWD